MPLDDGPGNPETETDAALLGFLAGFLEKGHAGPGLINAGTYVLEPSTLGMLALGEAEERTKKDKERKQESEWVRAGIQLEFSHARSGHPGLADRQYARCDAR